MKEMIAKNMKGLKYVELKWVSPDSFLRKVPSHGMRAKPKSVINLISRFSAGKPVDALYLDIKDSKVIHHQGRHRALVGKELGIEKIPVVEYHF